MSKWTLKEIEIVQWVLNNISELSLEEKHRVPLNAVRKDPLQSLSSYNNRELNAVSAALGYFIDLYTVSIKGYPSGNRTIRQIKERLEILNSAKQKALNIMETEV